jgi:hypothetical protein
LKKSDRSPVLMIETDFTNEQEFIALMSDDFGERGLCPRSPKSLLEYRYPRIEDTFVQSSKRRASK